MSQKEEKRREKEFFRRLHAYFGWEMVPMLRALGGLLGTDEAPFGRIPRASREKILAAFPAHKRLAVEKELDAAERIFGQIWEPRSIERTSKRKRRRQRRQTPVKLWIFSDLHRDIAAHFRESANKAAVEFYPPDEADIVILAGDIQEGTAGIDWANALGKSVLYVAGNHEFYRRNLEEVELALREKAAGCENVIFLHNDCVKIDGVRYLGTTLWTDYCLEDEEAVAKSQAEACMADHKVITTLSGHRRRLFTPDDAQAIHVRCREWLERELSQSYDGPTVVITHHGPHIRSVHPMYLGTSPVNGAFASDLTDLLKTYDIDLWVHGHTHWSFDYHVYGTRVVCNPFGYYLSEEIDDFEENLIVEII